MTEQRVHLVVGYRQPATGQRVLVLDRGRGVLGELAGEQPHPREHRTDLTCDHGIRMFEPGNNGDVPGKIAHPLQVTQRLQRCDHHPQVPGHRGLQCEQRDAAPLRIIVQRVHLITVSDHYSSESEISLV